MTSRAAKRQRTNSAKPEPQVNEVCSDGDVILYVEEKQHLLVSSAVLGACSKAFATMFNGRYLEGQQLSSTSPPTIDFPEDNAMAFKTLCQLAHGQDPWGCNKDYSTGELMDLTILSEKYGCLSVVRASLLKRGMSYLWLLWDVRKGRESNMDPMTLEEMIQHVIIAYTLTDARYFRYATCYLLQKYLRRDSMALAMRTKGSHLLPPDNGLWTLIAEERLHVRYDLMTDLWQSMGHDVAKLVNVEYDSLAEHLEWRSDGDDWIPHDLATLLDGCDECDVHFDDLLFYLTQDLKQAQTRLFDDGRIIGIQEIDLNRHRETTVRRVTWGPAWIADRLKAVEVASIKKGLCLGCMKNNKRRLSVLVSFSARKAATLYDRDETLMELYHCRQVDKYYT